MALNPQFVHERLRRAAIQFRWSRGARYLISGLAVSMFFLLVFLLCDTQFHFGAAGRWLGFLLTVSSLAGGVAMAVPEFFKKISDASIARRVEQSCAGSRNVLINAVQFHGELAADSPLRGALFGEMHDPFPNVRWRNVFDLPLLKKLAIALGSVALAITLWALVRPEHFINSAERIFLPAGNIAPLTRTRILEVTPGDTETAHGAEVDLSVTLGGEMPRGAWVIFRESGSSWQKTLMDHDVGEAGYTFEWKDVRQPVEYYIEAGDARSATYKINVRPRTAISSRNAEIEPPAYTKLGKITVPNFSMLQDVIPGSHVTVTLGFSAAVPELQADGDKGQQFPVTRQDETHWKFDGKIMSTQTVKLSYRDASGGEDSETLQIATRADEAPKINITAPQEGREIVATPDDSLQVQFTASARYGLGDVALYKSTNDKQDAQLIREWKEAADKTSFASQIHIPLRQYSAPGDDSVTFCIVVKDENDVSGPGVTISRPVVVSLRSADALEKQADEQNSQLRNSLEELITLQQTNLDETRDAAAATEPQPSVFNTLLDRQTRIATVAAHVAESGDNITSEIRADLRALLAKEMKDAVLALRGAGSTTGDIRGNFLSLAVNLEATILARLKGAPSAADADAQKGQIQDLIASVDNLLQEQRKILRETGVANGQAQAAKTLSDRQDALGDESVSVRKNIEKNAQNAALGDQDFRDRLTKVASMFGELRVYEDMLLSADRLQSAKFSDAVTTQKGIVIHLAKILEYLNQWQIANAEQQAEALKKEAADMKDKLDKLAAIQREIIEKSKELARKDQFNPDDVATAKEIKESKDLMQEVVEQMLTDAHIFPDLKPSNELRSELTQIYEDVNQTDKEQAAEGKLTPQEIAVQKEDGILQAIEQAKQIADDMEMWLPTNNETQKWLLENFDKTEIPDIPNLPLPDAFDDIVGKLLDEQQGLDQQVQDAASNQAAAQNPANGWEIRDGPQPGFGAQGKSGNERPNKNEQTGRSSGGREGESDGEMVNGKADNLEGTKPDARRTNDPMQQGQVKDDGDNSSTRATGGGKAAGFSDRNGMDGNAPLRATNAPSMAARDALAVQQALLAEKTSKEYAEASLLYLRTGDMADISRLMEESELALKEGRMQDYDKLHQQIIARLNEVRGEIHSGETLSLPASGAGQATDKQLLGGDEGSAPDRYKQQVADYYRSLSEEK